MKTPFYCRIHEGAKFIGERTFDPCDGPDSCTIVGGFLNFGLRLAAIQALAAELCNALAYDEEVIPGMGPLEAAETLRMMSETLITGTFDEDDRERLEKERYPDKALWLLDLAHIVGAQRGPRLIVEWPPLPTGPELHARHANGKPLAPVPAPPA